MLHLVTGKTGNGKGLFLLSEVEKRRVNENRQVFYTGIPELKFNWTEFPNARDWFKLPPNSIIVIDEAAAAFPVRPNSSATPEYISQFEFFRKSGFDIYIATQDPTFIDNHIRKLVDVHFHLMRVFGKEVSVLHKFFTCKSDVEKSRAGSISSDFHFPKELYGQYKSAEVHNIKAQPPFRYYLKYIIPVIVVLLIIAAYFSFRSAIHHSENNKTENQAVGAISMQQSNQTKGFNSNGAMHNEKLNEADDLLNYYQVSKPRIASLPLTAPKYDEVTKPTIAPVPAACVQMGKRCDCYTQQGTKMITEVTFCENVVKNGYFVDFDNEPKRDNRQNAQGINQAQAIGVSVRIPDVDQPPLKLLDAGLRASPNGA